MKAEQFLLQQILRISRIKKRRALGFPVWSRKGSFVESYAVYTINPHIIAPIPDKVAHAIARNFGWTIVPCGDTALNLLGLSTQVPAVWVYVSDGTYKEYSYDNTTIQFKRTTNKEVSKLSYKTALVIQALKALGKDNIDEMVISRLQKILTAEEKKAMVSEAKAVTSWIYEYLKQICRS